MPVHIEQMTSRVEVKGDGSPLSEEQVERLVQLVLERVEAAKRDEARMREANAIRDSALPPGPGGVW